jgi:hypothetical protein
VQRLLVLVALRFVVHFEGILASNEIPPSRKKREKGGATPTWEFSRKGWASPRHIRSLGWPILRWCKRKKPGPRQIASLVV